ncbi:Mannose-6-phosphate isomerase [Turnera subulata]|uniref:Mannose-6-phosphate isomerase n=1 Tax=Turnera subulata TaxID=218843 RepID=A0A9Q0J119_9ROSI|nr:Mannose-6-phosphate isomerase [Turnera subulata]
MATELINGNGNGNNNNGNNHHQLRRHVEEQEQPLPKRLRCSVQNYDWGKPGIREECQVARLCALNSGSEADSQRPYAELWMGTHDSGPSFVVGTKLSLKEWIALNPNVLGDKVLDRWGSNLPFLFKVLSVAKALSIQAHPDKELAKILHKLQPNEYKDDNHKPEMALAITEFEALCGFISLEEFKDVLRNVPEIVELVGNEDANKVSHMSEQNDEVKPVLKSIFTQLMSASKEMTTKVVSQLKSRLHTESQVRKLTDKEQLVLRLESQYSSDIGVVSAFFFNYVRLKPGEALYLGANEPHAYLWGECLECMATSDNVVRAGLTPKHRDIRTLCSMLTYKQGYPEILKGFPLTPYITRYLPPFDEFEVDRCVLPKGASTVFPAIPGPSIFLVTVGEGTLHIGTSNKSVSDVVSEGTVLFAPANTEIRVSTASVLHLYRCGVNSRFLQIL